MRPKRTDNLEAYDALLRGMEYHYRFTPEANTQARQLCERAIAFDPTYAEAYLELSFTSYLEWTWKWSQDSQALERADELVRKAIALDDSLARAHGLLGFVYVQQHRYDQAAAEAERAVTLAPNNAESYAMQADALLFAGRGADALRSIEQALRLNPRYPVVYLQALGVAYQQTGQYAEAIMTYKQVLVRNPNFVYAYVNLARVYIAQWAFQLSEDPQTLEQALAAAQRAVTLNDSLARAHVSLGYVYLAQKHYEQALAELERAVALDPSEAEIHATLAEALSRVGRPEDALQLVE